MYALDDLQALGDVTKDGVLTIQVGRTADGFVGLALGRGVASGIAREFYSALLVAIKCSLVL